MLGSGIGLTILSPLFLFVAIAIELDSPGPVFYRARRVGKDGRLFRLYKFRSMVSDADKRGPAITATGDNRITRVGRFLRHTKIDELPQLINVFLGDMSLVGPRPEDPRYVAHYTPNQKRILKFRPGMTSPASYKYRNEERVLTGEDWEKQYLASVLPDKLKIDLEYFERRTLTSDLTLIMKTILAMFR